MKLKSIIAIIVDIFLVFLVVPFIVLKLGKILWRYKIYTAIVIGCIIIYSTYNLIRRLRKCKYSINRFYKNRLGEIRFVCEVTREGYTYFIIYCDDYNKYYKCSEDEFKIWHSKRGGLEKE